MITAQDIVEHLHRVPFQPFVLHVSDGKDYEIKYPDLVTVFKNRLEIYEELHPK